MMALAPPVGIEPRTMEISPVNPLDIDITSSGRPSPDSVSCSSSIILYTFLRCYWWTCKSFSRVATRFSCSRWIAYYRIVCVRRYVSWLGLSRSGSDALFHVSAQWNSEDCSRNNRLPRNRAVVLTKRKRKL